MTKKSSRLVLAAAFVLTAIVGRIVLINLPNIEIYTAIFLLSGAIFGTALASGVAIVTLVLSDLALSLFEQKYGILHDPIIFFTWSAWLAITLLGTALRRAKKDRLSFVAKITGGGLISGLFFFLWTNFGVWATWNMYPKTFAGLLTCYTMGIPFLKLNLLSDLTVVPLAGLATVVALKSIAIVRQKTAHTVTQK